MEKRNDIEDFCETMLNHMVASWQSDILSRVMERAAHQGAGFYKIRSQEALSGYTADLVIIDDPYEGN